MLNFSNLTRTECRFARAVQPTPPTGCLDDQPWYFPGMMAGVRKGPRDLADQRIAVTNFLANTTLQGEPFGHCCSLQAMQDQWLKREIVVGKAGSQCICWIQHDDIRDDGTGTHNQVCCKEHPGDCNVPGFCQNRHERLY